MAWTLGNKVETLVHGASYFRRLLFAVRELGPERVVYGSDVGGRSFASQLSKVIGADIPESAKALVLGGNLRRLFTPILRAKGYQA